jgi:hypothetical protein
VVYRSDGVRPCDHGLIDIDDDGVEREPGDRLEQTKIIAANHADEPACVEDQVGGSLGRASINWRASASEAQRPIVNGRSWNWKLDEPWLRGRDGERAPHLGRDAQ